MKHIQLSQGKVALVDDNDYESLSVYKWCAKWDQSAETWYAVRNTPRPDHKLVFMHRVIIGASSPSEYVDHVDHNGLNNSRSNLRLCNNSQNQGNRTKRRGASSIYKGVTWDKSRDKWLSQIMVGRKSISLGRFENEIDAGRSYNEAAQKMHGEFALLNQL